MGQVDYGGAPYNGMPAAPAEDLQLRIAQLEAAVASLSTFITAEMRPDLGSGALTNESDRCQGC
jgi:hypothetical protein